MNIQRQDNAETERWTAKVGQALGQARFVVLLAVIAVLLVALSLFLLGGYLAVRSVWTAWQMAFQGKLHSDHLTVEFLEIVTVMLKAVVFYLVGVGMFSLFIAPLNVAVVLGINTFNDLEAKIINVVIVILAVTFLEHFIRSEDPVGTIQYGGAMALCVSALVLFQFYNYRSREAQRLQDAESEVR